MIPVLIATGNAHKVKEIAAILTGLPLKPVSLREAGIDIPEPEENGDTFRVNAEIKARAYGQAFGGWTLADDSGLVLPGLNGEPGIYSSRYAGQNASDADNRKKLIHRLEEKNLELPEAYFACCVCLWRQGQPVAAFQAQWYGQIIREEKGKNGFGYDPVFYLPERKMTAAELDDETKNAISHRAGALKLLKTYLSERV